MSCWVCGRKAGVDVLDLRDADRGVESFRLVSCSACGSGRLELFPSPAALSTYYDEAYYGRGDSKFATPLQAVVDFSVRRLARRIMRALAIVDHPRVLDVGCGRGALLEALARRGAAGIGLERAGNVPAGAPCGVEVRAGELVEQHFPAASLDAVVLWHVLEHLEDPHAVLTEIGRILKPGGLLVLAVPNGAGWQARFFGRHWFHVDAPRHLHCFGHEGLSAWLCRDGYALRLSSTSDPVQNLFGFVQSSLNLVPWTRPNRLYQLMRSAQSPRRLMEMLLWAVPAALLLLPALFEYGWSAVRGRGACSILFAVRQPSVGHCEIADR